MLLNDFVKKTNRFTPTMVRGRKFYLKRKRVIKVIYFNWFFQQRISTGNLVFGESHISI